MNIILQFVCMTNWIPKYEPLSCPRLGCVDSLHVAVMLAASSSLRPSACQRLWSQFSCCGSTLWRMVPLPQLSALILQIQTSWRSPHESLGKPSSVAGCSSDIWLLVCMLEWQQLEPRPGGSCSMKVGHSCHFTSWWVIHIVEDTLLV